MELFIDDANERVDRQMEKLIECKVIFRRTMKFYKFTPKKGTVEECQPAQFFEYWQQFVTDFRDIWKKEMTILSNQL